MRPGPRNLITDVPGISVGNADDAAVRSGVTVVVPEDRAVAALDVRGGATGSRDIELLGADATVQEIDALILSGGSAFALGAADAVQAAFARQGRGYPAGGTVVPIVPQAILFDLSNGGDKAWGENPPYRRLAGAALEAARDDFSLGTAGAGFGAIAGDLKGGLGSASTVMGDPRITVGALAAVNPVGAVTYAGCDRFFAWDVEIGNEFGGLGPPPRNVARLPRLPKLAGPAESTTLVVVATDAALTRAQARRIAVMAQDGLSHAIRPAHSPLDGDLVFVLSTGRVRIDAVPRTLALIGAVAATTVARAVARGVWEATAINEVPALRDRMAAG